MWCIDLFISNFSVSVNVFSIASTLLHQLAMCLLRQTLCELAILVAQIVIVDCTMKFLIVVPL